MKLSQLTYIVMSNVFKGERTKNFKKRLTYFLCNNIWSEKFISITKLVFHVKRELYLFYYNTIFKDHILLKQTQSSIEIDAIIVKKHVFFNFVEKYARFKWKKKVNVIITIIIEYAWMCLNKKDSEHASGPKYAKILNMTGF